MFDLKSIKTRATENPKDYILKDDGLEAAIQMAIWLGKPLLLTGAPGTGKTRLAFKLADMLATEENINKDQCAQFLDTPFIFNTKTTSTATDLFYNYDAVRHFQKRYVEESKSTAEKSRVVKVDNEDDTSSTVKISSVEAITSSNQVATAHPFIQLHALGKAIIQAYGKTSVVNSTELMELQFLQDFDSLHAEPRSSVVLIDEIDKAPRDFPNDLLNEMENMEFQINELMNKKIHRPNNNAQVLIIMTSNFEKNLPDAFLRRCLFYHIPPPEQSELITIVSKRLEGHLKELYAGDDKKRNTSLSNLIPANIEATVKEFEELKKLIKEKQPATAELLDWIKALEQNNFFDEPINFSSLKPEKKKILYNVTSALAKDDSDLENLKKKYAV